jgi:hypothetical protein
MSKSVLQRTPSPHSVGLVLIHSPVVRVWVKICRSGPTIWSSGKNPSHAVELQACVCDTSAGARAWECIFEPKAAHGPEVALRRHTDVVVTHDRDLLHTGSSAYVYVECTELTCLSKDTTGNSNLCRMSAPLTRCQHVTLYSLADPIHMRLQ